MFSHRKACFTTRPTFTPAAPAVQRPASADESAAREYIDYCKQWATLFNIAANDLGEQVLDKEKDIKAYVIQFSNGTKIHALSSNPKGFRSKGGKVVLDEFAFHNNPAELWKAARPCITWGYPLRILSTHNGQSCLYYKFLDQVERGKLKWSHHKTPIQLAVAEGLVDKISEEKQPKQNKKNGLKKNAKTALMNTLGCRNIAVLQ